MQAEKAPGDEQSRENRVKCYQEAELSMRMDNLPASVRQLRGYPSLQQKAKQLGLEHATSIAQLPLKGKSLHCVCGHDFRTSFPFETCLGWYALCPMCKRSHSVSMGVLPPLNPTPRRGCCRSTLCVVM